MATGQFAIYKGLTGKFGAIQAKLMRPRIEEGRDGGVLLEVAKTVGKNSYDWGNKLLFALGVSDIQYILGHDYREDKLKLTHAKDGNTKTMVLAPGNKGTFFFSFYGQTKSGEDFEMSMPISRGEWRVFTHILLQSVPSIIAWGYDFSKK